MNCMKCNAEVPAGEEFCPICGIRMQSHNPEPDLQPIGKAAPGLETTPRSAETAPPVLQTARKRSETSGFAIASLVSGILGLVLLPFFGPILALVFGAVARGDIRKSDSDNRLGGAGMAKAGIALGAIGLILVVLIVSVAVPLLVIFVKPEIDAANILLDGTSAARVYYLENGRSFEGINPEALSGIDDSVEYSDVAKGRDEKTVYLHYVNPQSIRLFCYSARDKKYISVATGEDWNYSFRFWHGMIGYWGFGNNSLEI